MKKPIHFITALAFLLSATPGFTLDNSLKVFEVYGIIMTDVECKSNQINPEWFDVVRPAELPAFKNEFGSDGRENSFTRSNKL